MITAFFFYLLSAVAIASGVMVIASRNPVHSVLFLILAFFNAAGLFILLGAEFLAMILVVVYVGAVAVLFLFVVMMLDVDFSELREGMAAYLPVGATARTKVASQSALSFTLEFDLLIHGWQKTCDSQLGGGDVPPATTAPGRCPRPAACSRR